MEQAFQRSDYAAKARQLLEAFQRVRAVGWGGLWHGRGPHPRDRVAFFVWCGIMCGRADQVNKRLINGPNVHAPQLHSQGHVDRERAVSVL